MKTLLLIACILLMPLSYATTVEEAFKEFYDDELISSNHCGKNIHFFLNYLKKQHVEYGSGHVISVFDDYAMLNHFDARWGSREDYTDGTSYRRSNYYFHVFLIIDGRAYDFSQNLKSNQSVTEYLKEVYLPKLETENIFFQGKLTPLKVLKKHHNTKLKVYSLEQYMSDYKGNIYEGSFVELFNYYENKINFSSHKPLGEYELSYASREISKWGTIYREPEVIKDGKRVKLMAHGRNICRTFGHFGAHPGKTIHEVSDELLIYKIYSSIDPSFETLNSKDFKISFTEMKTVGAIPNQPLLHYAKSVTCTDLAFVLEHEN